MLWGITSPILGIYIPKGLAHKVLASLIIQQDRHWTPTCVEIFDMKASSLGVCSPPVCDPLAEDHLLKVHSAGVHLSPAQSTSEDLAHELVERACANLDLNGLPGRLTFLYVTGHWCCDRHEDVPRKVRQEIKRKLGYEVPLIGGSMARIYCTATESSPVIEEGAAIAILFTEELWASVEALPHPFEYKIGERLRRLRELRDKLGKQKRHGIGLGASADHYLFGIMPGYGLDPMGRRYTRDAKLYDEILQTFHRKLPLYGASAADSLAPTCGYQFADDRWMRSGLALALVETDLRIGSSMAHGFRPIPELRVSVDRVAGDGFRSQVVLELDGKPAAQRLREIVVENGIVLDAPVLGTVSTPEPQTIKVVNSLIDGQPVVLSRTVEYKDRLYVLDASKEDMSRTARQTLRDAFQDAEIASDDARLQLVLGFICASRVEQYEKLGEPWSVVLDELAKESGTKQALAGVCAGEFGIHKDYWGMNNLSVTVNCITGQYHEGARNRVFLRKILEAVAEPLAQKTPKAVMEKALKGAIRAGATGGQICLVDMKLRRIFGRTQGHAENAPDSAQDWKRALEATEREIPLIDGPVRVPAALRGWARPVQLPPPGAQPMSVPYDVDILAISALTKHAVFITDSTLQASFCHTDLAKKCHIESQLILPLIGSSEEVIATMQLGFQRGEILDEESIQYWIGYSQKVASAVERAQETEERLAAESITSLVNDLTQIEPSDDPFPETLFHRYLDAVKVALGADYVHMRSERRAGSKEYDLIAPIGQLAALHRLARPTVPIGSGSCRPDLPKQGRFLNTFDETSRFYLDAQAVYTPRGDTSGIRAAWMKEVRKVQSAAIIPLFDIERYLGPLVVDSQQEYFFTSRRQRMTQVAANGAAAISRALKARYDRRQRQKQGGRLVRMKNDLMQALIEQPSTDWGRALEVIREGFLVDSAELVFLNTGQDTTALFAPKDGRKLSDTVPKEVLNKLKNGDENYSPVPLSKSPDMVVYSVVSSDSVVQALLFMGGRLKTLDNPFGFENVAEQQAIRDVTVLLGSALAAEANRREREELQSQIVTAQKIGAAGLLGSMVMHRMLTPLAVIQRAIEELRVPNSEMGHPRLADIIEARKNELLAQIRGVAERPVIGNTLECFRSLVRLAVTILESRVRQPHVERVIENNASGAVQVDLWSIVGALVNIMSNALDAIGDHGQLWIRASTTRDGRLGLISVKNTGPAPPEHMVPHLFEAGVSSKKGDPNHLGLGLPLAKKAVEAAGGKIEFIRHNSELSEVVVTLPLIQDANHLED